MKKDILNKGLPKWPALIVVGEAVTREQAAEIIIRTSGFSFSSNDRDFEKQINQILYNVSCDEWSFSEAYYKQRNIPKEKQDWNEPYDYKKNCVEKYAPIDLNYLENSQILSCWIGGAHGWCNWDGRIFTDNYNIGKWPSVEDVYDDWKLIAKAFPFLNLKCQLLSGETCEENIVPLVQFNIKKGRVTLTEPKQQLSATSEIDYANIFKFNRERGCTIEQFKEALEITEKSVSANKFATLA